MCVRSVSSKWLAIAADSPPVKRTDSTVASHVQFEQSNGVLTWLGLGLGLGLGLRLGLGLGLGLGAVRAEQRRAHRRGGRESHLQPRCASDRGDSTTTRWRVRPGG